MVGEVIEKMYPILGDCSIGFLALICNHHALLRLYIANVLTEMCLWVQHCVNAGNMLEVLMAGNESKSEKFRRLASARGDRVIRELGLLSNLSNESNYEYTDQEVQKLFAVIDAELRECKARFTTRTQRRRVEF